MLVNDFLKEIGENNIMVFRGAYAPLLTMFPWNDGKLYERIYKTKPISFFVVVGDRDTSFAYNDNYYKGYGIEVFLDYLNGGNLVKRLNKKSVFLRKKIEKKYFSIKSKNLNNLDNAALAKYAKEMSGLLSELIAYTVYTETFDRDIVRPFLNEKDGKILDNIWDKATKPIFESFEMRHLRAIIDEYKKNKENLAARLQYIYTDYFWPKSENEILNELKNIIGSNGLIEQSRAKLLLYEDTLEKQKRDFDKWLGGLSNREKQFVWYIQLVMSTRDWRKDPFAQAQAAVAGLCVESLRRAGIDAGAAPYVLPQELANGIEWLRENKTEISKRKSGAAIYLKYTGELRISAAEARESREEIERFELSRHDKDIKGQTGSRGMAHGRCRIIIDASLSGDFQDGEILVTGMTRPEFVPLMKRATAIVTDEGGITCHAAIVSRELGIPCIIGTKIATKVLKDGDEVEVDATHGIVKVIKRA